MTITNFLFSNTPFKRKSRVSSSRIPHLTQKTLIFSSQIPHLCENHEFSLLKYPIYVENTCFLYKNPPFNPKITRFLKSAIYAKITRFLFASPPFKRKSVVFSSRIPRLSENHTFSLRKSHIYAKISFSF